MSHSAKKVENGTPLLWNAFLFHVRSFRIVQNQVLSSHGISAFRVSSNKKRTTSHSNSQAFFLRGKALTKKIKMLHLFAKFDKQGFRYFMFLSFRYSSYVQRSCIVTRARQHLLALSVSGFPSI